MIQRSSRPARVIVLENLNRHFGGIHAVKNLSFEVPQGIVFGFLGPNGSGKTTTIRLLLGLLEPDSGHAQVLGLDCERDAAAIRARTGALLEHPGLYERLSAEENLDFHARVWRLPRCERRTRVHEVLERMGLWDRRGEQVGTWSRGMKQKLGVARALLHRPELVFLDEPTSGLDPVAASSLRSDLARLVREMGLTVFLTTHNLSEVESFCERIALIRRGELIAVGHPDEIRSRASEHKAVVIGRAFHAELLDRLRESPAIHEVSLCNGRLNLRLRDNVRLAPIVRLLVDHGVEIEEIRRVKVSLEEVFLSMMQATPSVNETIPWDFHGYAREPSPC